MKISCLFFGHRLVINEKRKRGDLQFICIICGAKKFHNPI